MILRVAIPSPLHTLFDYLCPVEFEGRVKPGMRIKVPFGSREMIGIVIDTDVQSQYSTKQLKTALMLLDEHPVLDATQFWLARWAAHYYFYPEGEALQQALPVLLRKGHEPTFAHATLWRATAHATLNVLANGAKRQRELLELLLRNPDGVSSEAIKIEAFRRPYLKP
ncbi:hypothetical protein [Nitrincola nitratireducens]|uniref:Primosomal protein N n=1 Tax=Nitrincola nitratireducens TaxID=1229521 RepID=W9VJW9_9GAMM|nr:Primosomal protein N' [Nitrincola nitratireducens]